MKTKYAVLTKPGKFEISEKKLNLESEQVLVRIAACGLCNWELNHWKGLLGNFPQTLGHEWAGTIADKGSEVKGFSIGDEITILPEALTGFSEYAVIKAGNCFKIATNVKLEHALGEPLKCIVTVLRAVRPEIGDNGLIIGCGPMGLWCIQALSGNLLSSLIAVDIDDEKLKLARKFGATHTINPRKNDVQKKISEITNNLMSDFVIEGTGVPGILNSAMLYLKTQGRGRLILMSSHEEMCKEFDFREAIKRSIEIIVPHPGYSINQIDDTRRAVLCLNNGTFNMDDIITHRFTLDNIQMAFETLENKPEGYIKGIVVP